MPKQRWWLLLLLFILADTTYSFVQHLNVALDGDMAFIIVPAEWYRPVLSDPLGLGVLLRNEVYAAPNRFFAHWFMSAYFKAVPLALQAFLPPIESVYMACALLKIAVQLFLMAMLASYIRPAGPERSGGWRAWLLAAVLVVPLFHASGYNMQMGIIDKSVGYTVFYALPLGLLLVFLLPFYRAAFSGQPLRLNMLQHVALVLLAVVLALGGPLVPAVVLLLCPGVLLYQGWQHWQRAAAGPVALRLRAVVAGIPRPQLFHFAIISLLCLYSLYIGLNNLENLTGESISVAERYGRLPQGLYSQLTVKVGIPLLLVLVGINTVLLRRQPSSPATVRLLRIVRALGLFAVVYLLLLPLGGYRPYRPHIIRRDTFLPVLLGLVYVYGLTTYYLLGTLRGKPWQRFAFGLAAFLLYMTLADKPIRGENACEKAALQQLANSWEKTVRLEGTDCTVMGWNKITNPTDSEQNAELIHYWGITHEKRLYYQQ